MGGSSPPPATSSFTDESGLHSPARVIPTRAHETLNMHVMKKRKLKDLAQIVCGTSAFVLLCVETWWVALIGIALLGVTAFIS